MACYYEVQLNFFIAFVSSDPLGLYTKLHFLIYLELQ